MIQALSTPLGQMVPPRAKIINLFPNVFQHLDIFLFRIRGINFHFL